MKISIINSKGHWSNGWFTEPVKLQIVIDILQKAGFEVSPIEVKSLKQLETVLDGISQDTLVWTNGYWVNKGKDQVGWLNEYVENRGLSLVGSSAKTLQQLLEKDKCQLQLQEASIPMPLNIIIENSQITEVRNIITDSKVNFPVVLKPTTESCSKGIKMAKDLNEATEMTIEILNNFPHSKVIMEEFLASDDITCGYLQLGEEAMLLPSYPVIKGLNGKNNIYNREHWALPFSDKNHVCIEDESILSQLKTHVPSIVEVFNIQNITRVDGRLDKNGTLSFFDVNGLPALNFPVSAMLRQCFSHFSNYSHKQVFESLIYTILYSNLMRYNMRVPGMVSDNNLFNLESRSILKLQLEFSELI